VKKANIIAILNSIPVDYSEEVGLSGGDRILLESLKIWKDKVNNVAVITCNSGKLLIEKYIDDLMKIRIHVVRTPRAFYKNLLLLFVYKTITATFLARKISSSNGNETVIFSQSDIFPDVIPAFFSKLISRNLSWSAAFYFFASSPFSKEFPYTGIGSKLRGTIYYLTQKVCYVLITKFADNVVACNEIDRQRFIKKGYPENRICAIYGGVDLSIPALVSRLSRKEYDCVFMARFHPQKGPMIAVKAWKEVIKVKKGAKLAMIGNGPEEGRVRGFISDNHLQDNVVLLGFMDGIRKYEVLKASRIFLHTAVYETGGMAAAEGMAAGLPVIAFDHEGFDYCYPKGISRVSPIGDHRKIADRIIELLENEHEYQRLKGEASELVKSWDWRTRAIFLLEHITS